MKISETPKHNCKRAELFFISMYSGSNAILAFLTTIICALSLYKCYLTGEADVIAGIFIATFIGSINVGLNQLFGGNRAKRTLIFLILYVTAIDAAKSLGYHLFEGKEEVYWLFFGFGCLYLFFTIASDYYVAKNANRFDAFIRSISKLNEADTLALSTFEKKRIDELSKSTFDSKSRVKLKNIFFHSVDIGSCYYFSNLFHFTNKYSAFEDCDSNLSQEQRNRTVCIKGQIFFLTEEEMSNLARDLTN